MPVTQFKLRRGTAAQWAAANPVLAQGEPGYATDVKTFKIGNGVETWNELTSVADEAVDRVVDSLEESAQIASASATDAAVASSASAAASASSAASSAALAEQITGLDDVAGAMATTDANAASGFRVQQDARLGRQGLGSWLRKLGDDPANAKIVFSGDSTTEGAAQMYTALKLHRVRGAEFDGMASANFVNHGNTGFALQDFLNHTNSVGGAPVPSNTWASTVAAAPHLIVASWGINDVRTGGCTEAQLKARLVEFINIVKRDLPNTDLVLRIPNPMVTTGGAFISGITAHDANNIIREAYLSLQGVYSHVVVIDIAPVFGSATLATSWLMSDQLHPVPQGHWITGHYLATKIGLPNRTPPKMGPPSRYVRTGYVNTVSGTQIHIDAIEWAGGVAQPNHETAQEWQIESDSVLYTESGATSMSGVVKSTTSTQTLILTKSGFDWATVAVAGQMVQLVGHHAPNGFNEVPRSLTVDPPSMATLTGGGVDVATGFAVVGRAISVSPPTSFPDGIIYSAKVKSAGTIRIEFFNTTGGTLNPGADTWKIWFGRG